jgi:hypothetical protein
MMTFARREFTYQNEAGEEVSGFWYRTPVRGGWFVSFGEPGTAPVFFQEDAGWLHNPDKPDQQSMGFATALPAVKP